MISNRVLLSSNSNQYSTSSIMRCHWTFILVVAIGVSVHNAESARILAVFPFPGTSHNIITNSYVAELAARGHELTVIGTEVRKAKHPNITDIYIDMSAFWAQLKEENVFEFGTSVIGQFLVIYNMCLLTTETTLKDENIQTLINGDDVKFDLVLVEHFYHDALLMFGHKYKAPVVALSPFGFAHNMGPAMGFIVPTAYLPHEFLSYGDHMTFWQRLYNVLVSTFDYVVRRLFLYPRHDALIQKYFKNIPYTGPLPSVAELERKTSLVLLNNHLSISTPIPLLPGIVEVGGAHIKPVKPLPEDLKKYLDDSKDGVVYFSLGSVIRSANLPKPTVVQILSVLSKLKQKVLWKWEDDTLDNIPANVKIQKWWPQSDILAHPNIRLFITHGGLLSTLEAIHRGVPVIGIPVFGDQYLNMMRAEMSGFGLTVQYSNLTDASLAWALDEMLNNVKYTENARRLSNIFHDRPLPPLDMAMFWIEHVIRHKGATHLRSPALDLPWPSFFLLDVGAFLLVSLLVTLFITYKTISIFISVVFKSKKEIKKKKDKKME